MKNCFSFVILISLSASILMSAQSANPASDFVYDLNADGTGVIIKEYKGTTKDVIIPAIIEDFPVVTVDSAAFHNKTNIVSVVIPDSVKNFVYWQGWTGNFNHVGVFSGCKELQKITLSKNLENISSYCFYECKALKEITLPQSLKEIGGCAFECSGLESVVVPDSVQVIYNEAFRDCYALTTVTVGDGVQVVCESAFYGCAALATVSIGKGIKSIERGAFCACSSLTTFNLGVQELESNEYFEVDGSNYYSGYGRDVFRGCSSLNLKAKAEIRKTGYRGEF